ncbi:hypothetical protein BUALT_BualtUnG0024800 [Buddleja alternifolia]|uniref:phosphoribosylformylglycinamidine cyclo-ligase n=1 Tax=Buddleja alternifolia TaxID=168488 RepID=A0AAV6W049_9LAMI|nr:hypothetical protein BUALT_BualtUnG0024800 [Buddleja alternifolia]
MSSLVYHPVAFIRMDSLSSEGVLERSGLSFKHNLRGSSITLGEALMAPTVIYVRQAEKIEDVEMMRTLNMAIGMVLVVKEEAALRILEDYHDTNLVYRIGEVISGD